MPMCFLQYNSVEVEPLGFLHCRLVQVDVHVCDTRLELEKEAQATERRVLAAGPLNKNGKKR